MAKILVVEDDTETAKALCAWLDKEKHTPELAMTGEDATGLLATYQYDVIILDWHLPDIEGIQILGEYRKAGGKTPIIMLTGKSDIAHKMTGLDQGADDYVVKPVDMRELSARIRALLRRSPDVAATVMQMGDLMLDPANSSVTVGGQKVLLPPREFSLLEFLMRHPDQFFSADALIDRVWRSDSEVSDLSVRICVKRIRDKIDRADRESYIESHKGLGYRMRSPR